MPTAADGSPQTGHTKAIRSKNAKTKDTVCAKNSTFDIQIERVRWDGMGWDVERTDKHEQLPPLVHLPQQVAEAVLVFPIEAAVGEKQHQLARCALGADPSSRHRKATSGRLKTTSIPVGKGGSVRKGAHRRGNEGMPRGLPRQDNRGTSQ